MAWAGFAGKKQARVKASFIGQRFSTSRGFSSWQRIGLKRTGDPHFDAAQEPETVFCKNYTRFGSCARIVMYVHTRLSVPDPNPGAHPVAWEHNLPGAQPRFPGSQFRLLRSRVWVALEHSFGCQWAQSWRSDARTRTRRSSRSYTWSSIAFWLGEIRCDCNGLGATAG